MDTLLQDLRFALRSFRRDATNLPIVRRASCLKPSGVLHSE